MAMEYHDLEPHEKRIIEELDASREIRKILPLGQAIEEWQKFTECIEAGYTLTIYDYTNELSGREIIEDYLADLPSMLRNKVLAIVTPADEQFRGLTTETDKVLMGQNAAEYHTRPWWYHRIPKKLVGELKEDVNAL